LKRIGTWGPGHNAISNIHVIDAAKALLQIFEAALEGKADVGSEGHCEFVLQYFEAYMFTVRDVEIFLLAKSSVFLSER